MEANSGYVKQSPEELVSKLDFTYIEDFLTKEDALEILKKSESEKNKREKELIEKGYPAYVTSAGWLGYDDNTVSQNCNETLNAGFNSFKVKVGVDIKYDKRRLKLIRSIIGENRLLMTDANQKWSVQESINWMKNLVEYKPYWIEEPTCCDDIYGHAQIAKELKPYGIKVATGEHCHNRVMFKQFLKSGGMDICQIDCCRLAGPNEIILVLLMAAKAGVPVCPHAGGVGLCEMVQHYSYIDYISITGTTENRMIEFADHLHEQYENPVVVKNGHYQIPKEKGFGGKLILKSIDDYSFPDGSVWKTLREAKK